MTRIAKIHITGFLALLSLTDLSAQIEWVAGTPSVASVGPLTITLNYGLRRSGVVYIVIYNYDNHDVLTSSNVRALAREGPDGPVVSTSVTYVTNRNTNDVLQIEMRVRDPNQIHTIYMVAERLGFLQPFPVRLTAVTLPCIPPNAGTGGTECDLNFALNATPGGGEGLWTVVSGPGSAIFTPNARTPNAIVTVSAYGTYIFRWTELNGVCSGSSEISVSFYQQPHADAGRGGDVCSDSYVLNAASTSDAGTGKWTMTGGTGNARFSPDETSPNATVTVTEYGTKVFTWTVTNGPCQSSSDVTVNFIRQPQADAGTGGEICGLELYLNASMDAGTGTWTRVSGPGRATFSPDAGSPDARVTVSRYGVYVFMWTVVNGPCSASSTISVSFLEQIAANAGTGGDECDRDFQLNAVPGLGSGIWSVVSGPGTAVFSPNASQPDAIVTVSQYGSYDFAWSETTSNCSSADIIRVVFHEPPTVAAGPDLMVCRGNSIQLNASGTGSFSWSPSEPLNNPLISNPVASLSENTLFTVTITDEWGCPDSDQVLVVVKDLPIADAGPDQHLEFIFEADLQAGDLNNDEEGEWSVYSGSGEFTGKNDSNTRVWNLSFGENILIWTVSNGVCPHVADTVRIKVQELLIPTLITPNSDGINDLFFLNGLQSLGRTRLTVFNRWGAMVYNNDDYDNGWDGKHNYNYDLPDDTYFFILNPENTKSINGYIVIRR